MTLNSGRRGDMRTAHVKFADPKYNYCTSINGSDSEIRSYFVGNFFNFGDTEAHPRDDMQKCIDVVIED